MSEKHTQGPWIHDGGTDRGYSIYPADSEGDPVVWSVGGIARLPDAQLIAAAPDLFAACEALQAVVAALAQGQPVQRAAADAAVAQSLTAIAKARGEEAAPSEALDPETVRELLLLAGVDVPIAAVSSWSDDQRETAADWAGAVHLAASDNDDVAVPEKPAFLRD